VLWCNLYNFNVDVIVSVCTNEVVVSHSIFTHRPNGNCCGNNDVGDSNINRMAVGAAMMMMMTAAAAAVATAVTMAVTMMVVAVVAEAASEQNRTT